MQKLIYLDYASTTPVDEQVAAKMSEHMTMNGVFGNPASRSHRFGWQAEEAVEAAREQVANLLNADPREIVFTSGATESDNLAIKGVADYYNGASLVDNGESKKHIITSKTEHKAVLDTCLALEKEGYEVTYLTPASDGTISVAELEGHIRKDTLLVSLMHVNNETGVIQDLQSIGELCRDKGVFFHVDAAQSAGKVAIDLSNLPVDLMSFSGHKIYGPKGIGALYVSRKPKVNVVEQMHGGKHERGMRSGTLATHQIVGLGEAFAIAGAKLESEHARLTELREKFVEGLNDLSDIILNGDQDNVYPGIINVSFADLDGESLLMALKDIAVSSGSACTSASLEPSYVLTAMGIAPELAHASIRFSFGRYTTEEDIDLALDNLFFAVPKLRDIAG